MTKDKTVKVYAYFQSDKLDSDGTMTIEVKADRDKLVNGLADAYEALPEFIRDQVQGLNVCDDVTDVDITEIVAGRHIADKK